MGNGTSEQRGSGSRGVTNRGTTHRPGSARRKHWVPLRLPSGQAETDENVFRLIASLKRRSPNLKHITSGRLKGDVLSFGGKQFALEGISGVAKGTTISGALGPGVFMLKPLPKESGTTIRWLRGDHPYEVWIVSASGRLRRKGMQIGVFDLGVIKEGLFIYSTRTLHVDAGFVITARIPRDVRSLFQKIRNELDYEVVLIPINPAIQAINIINYIEAEKLSKQEFKLLIDKLRNGGLLGRFFNLVHIPRFRDYLKKQSLTWDFIFSHWAPNFNDTGRFLAGYIAGVGQSITSAIELLKLMDPPFAELLARDPNLKPHLDEIRKRRAEFFAGIRKFFRHPWTNTIKGIKKLYKSFKDALWKLDFFEAGRILGNVVIAVLTLPSAIKSLPKAAKFIGKGVLHLAKLTAEQLRRLGVAAKELRRFLLEPSYQLVTPNGFVLVTRGDDVIAFNQSGGSIGRIPKSDINILASKLDDVQSQTLSSAMGVTSNNLGKLKVPKAQEFVLGKPYFGAIKNLKKASESLLRAARKKRAEVGITLEKFRDYNVGVGRFSIEGSQDIIRSVVNVKKGQHAEQLLVEILDELRKVHKGKKVTLVELYTERIPCVGHCRGLLTNVSPETKVFHTVSGTTAQVYSTTKAKELMRAYGVESIRGKGPKSS
jgi:hypothetical protein